MKLGENDINFCGLDRSSCFELFKQQTKLETASVQNTFWNFCWKFSSLCEILVETIISRFKAKFGISHNNSSFENSMNYSFCSNYCCFWSSSNCSHFLWSIISVCLFCTVAFQGLIQVCPTFSQQVVTMWTTVLSFLLMKGRRQVCTFYPSCKKRQLYWQYYFNVPSYTTLTFLWLPIVSLRTLSCFIQVM